MGLKMKLDFSNGVSIEYWKLGNVVINHSTRTAHACVEGYLTRAARLMGCETYHKISISIESEYDFRLTDTLNEIMTKIYTIIKKRKDFCEAQDVIE